VHRLNADGAKLPRMEEQGKLRGAAKCGLCGDVFRFDPNLPISMMIEGVRKPACEPCRDFGKVWRSAFAAAGLLEAPAVVQLASEPPVLPRRRDAGR
jgi:hypothetical protein